MTFIVFLSKSVKISLQLSPIWSALLTISPKIIVYVSVRSLGTSAHRAVAKVFPLFSILVLVTSQKLVPSSNENPAILSFPQTLQSKDKNHLLLTINWCFRGMTSTFTRYLKIYCIIYKAFSQYLISIYTGWR